jgi:hypothetical protein
MRFNNDLILNITVFFLPLMALVTSRPAFFGVWPLSPSFVWELVASSALMLTSDSTLLIVALWVWMALAVVSFVIGDKRVCMALLTGRIAVDVQLVLCPFIAQQLLIAVCFVWLSNTREQRETRDFLTKFALSTVDISSGFAKLVDPDWHQVCF